MQGVEKSRKEEERLNGTPGLRSFIHEGRGFTRTRSSTELRQEKPHAKAACGHSLRGSRRTRRHECFLAPRVVRPFGWGGPWNERKKPAVHRGLEGSVMGWRDESS